MDRWGYCLRGVQEYLTTERQSWKKHRQIPPCPSKKGVIWTMQYMFVSGLVGCKKTVSAAYQFQCHYKQLRDLQFSTFQSIRVFRIFRRKKLELEIFLTSDKMALL